MSVQQLDNQVVAEKRGEPRFSEKPPWMSPGYCFFLLNAVMHPALQRWDWVDPIFVPAPKSPYNGHISFRVEVYILRTVAPHFLRSMGSIGPFSEIQDASLPSANLMDKFWEVYQSSIPSVIPSLFKNISHCLAVALWHHLTSSQPIIQS